MGMSSCSGRTCNQCDALLQLGALMGNLRSSAGENVVGCGIVETGLDSDSDSGSSRCCRAEFRTLWVTNNENKDRLRPL